MTKEELKNKCTERAKEFVSKKASGTPYAIDYYANLLVEFANEATKELQEDLKHKKIAIQNRKARIKDLEKENAELRAKYLQATDEGTSWAHLKSLEKENAELKAQLQKKINTTTVSDYPYSALKLEESKDLIENIIRVTWGEGWNYSLDWKVKAEQFLKE